MGQSYALPLPITSKHIQRTGNQHFRTAVVSMQGWRRDMEDSHVMDCKPNYGFFGVFDGHSGSRCSKQVAEMFSDRISKTKLPLTDLALEQMALDIDGTFLHKNEGFNDGSTAVFCVALPKDGKYHLQIGNVGDSRIIVGSGGIAKAMTIDHKPSLPAEEARIIAAGGFVAQDRVNGELAVSRAMGDRPYKTNEPREHPTAAKKPKKKKAAPATRTELQVIAQPEISHTVLNRGEWLLVACDGIFEPDSFTNEEVISFIHHRMAVNEDLGDVLCALCTEALKRGSTDNMTAMLVQCADGTGYGPAEQFVPGPFDPDMGSAMHCYFSFANDYGELSKGQVLELRYDMLQKLLAERTAQPVDDTPNFKAMKPQQLKEWLTKYGANRIPTSKKELQSICVTESDQHRFYDDSSLRRIQEELAWYKGGPTKGLVGTKRTKWFETMAAGLPLDEEDGEDGGFNLDELSNLPPEALQQLIDQGLLHQATDEDMAEMEGAEQEASATAKAKKKKKKTATAGPARDAASGKLGAKAKAKAVGKKRKRSTS